MAKRSPLDCKYIHEPLPVIDEKCPLYYSKYDGASPEYKKHRCEAEKRDCPLWVLSTVFEAAEEVISAKPGKPTWITINLPPRYKK
jgi:hypothetical protein